MTEMIHVEAQDKQAEKINLHDEFKAEVHAGLSKPRKQLSSKFFYDEIGSDLFNRITRHPDYYLTQCELDILNTHKNEIAELINSRAFNLVELGPGEGIKTKILLNNLLNHQANFTYTPIDISTAYLQELSTKIENEIKGISVAPIHGDYFHGLNWLKTHSNKKNVVLFLGSSIGNFDLIATQHFLKHLWQVLNKQDEVILGFDLRKDIKILLRAYDDDQGITKQFNLNLLRRINDELGANFNIKQFQHYATYNVYTGAMESYLLSKIKQKVDIAACQQSYLFDALEPIHMEYSHKYLLSQIEELAKESGFAIVKHFFDKKQFFVDTLWRKE